MIRRLFYPLSYRVRVSMFMALFALIPLSLFGSFYFKNQLEKWNKDALENYMQMVSISSEKFSQEVQEMELKIFHLSNMQSIRSAISNISSKSLLEALELIDILKETVSSITVDNSYLVARWYPYNSQRNFGSYSYPIESLRQEFAKDDVLLENILDLDTGKLLMDIREINRISNDKEKIEKRFCVYLKMVGVRGGECLVEMSMPVHKMIELQGEDLPEGSILGICLQLNHDQQTFLILAPVDEAETILDTYHLSGKCPGYYPYVSQIDGLPGSQIICLFPKDYVMEQTYDEIIAFVVVIVLFLLTVVACSYVVSAMLTNRVNYFLEQINTELDTILLEPTVVTIGDSDLESIAKRIRRLIFNTQEYYAKLKQNEEEKSRLELELLQMRFNPHFLYNTLNSIRYQVKEKRIRKSIDSLIHYYRIVLSKGYLVISIEEELEMIREYLELEIYAYQLQNISFQFAIEEQVKEFTIVKHLLQPIVENALEHGLRVRDTEGTIWIRAKVDEMDIVFEIEDNGAGMTEEQIESLLSEPERGSANGGYGVYNVQQRVETYYGKQYGLTVYAKPGEGTLVTLRIPKQGSTVSASKDGVV